MNFSNPSSPPDMGGFDPELLEEDDLQAVAAEQDDARVSEHEYSLPPVEEDYFTSPDADLNQPEDYYEPVVADPDNTTVLPEYYINEDYLSGEDYLSVAAPNYTPVPEDFFEPTDDALRPIENHIDNQADDEQIRTLGNAYIDDTPRVMPASFISEGVESAKAMAEGIAEVAEQVFEARFLSDASLASRIWELQPHLAEQESYEGREVDQTELNVLGREIQMRQRTRAIVETLVKDLVSDAPSFKLLLVSYLGAGRLGETPYFMSELSNYKHHVYGTCADALPHVIKDALEHGDARARAEEAQLKQILSLEIDLLPGVGDLKGVIEAIVDEDLVTGKDLAWWERILNATPLLPNLWKLRHLDDVGNLRHADDAADVARAGNKLLDIARVAANTADINRIVDPDIVTSVLLPLRDEAVRLTDRLAAVETALGRTIGPQEFGELADAIFKSHVKHAQDIGQLPKRLQIASTALRVSGTRLEKGVDIWDPVTGAGWDLMTQTVGSVAKHEKYIGQPMRDGTIIKDVIPMIYKRK